MAIRAADAKEVGVGNPAEETYRYPNQILKSYMILKNQPEKSTLKTDFCPVVTYIGRDPNRLYHA